MISPPRYVIEISVRATLPSFAEDVLCKAAETTLSAEQIPAAEISIVLTDDAEIHRINREFLGHDCPTDVISFRLDGDQPPPGSGAAIAPPLEGELIVSLETAARAAAVEGWSLESEVVLYVVHGLLHLCGYDDLSDDARSIMRQREHDILTELGRPPAAAIEPG